MEIINILLRKSFCNMLYCLNIAKGEIKPERTILGIIRYMLTVPSVNPCNLVFSLFEIIPGYNVLPVIKFLGREWNDVW